MEAWKLGEADFETKLVIALVSGSEFVNHTFIVLLPPILGLLAEDFRVSLALLGVALGARGGATALFQLPFGYVSDRYDRTIGLGASLGIGSLGALVTAVAPSLPALVVGQVLVGVGVAGHHPSHFPLLSEAVEEQYRARVFSVRGFAGALGFATPPIVVTAVLALPGTTWRHAIALLGALGLVYGALTIGLFRRYVSKDVTMPDPEAAPIREDGASIRERLRGELRSFVAMPAVLALGGLTFVTAIYTSGFRTYVVVHLTDGYGLALGTANLALTGLFVVGAVAMLAGGSLADRVHAGAVLTVAYVVLGLLTVVLASLVVPAVVAIGVAVAIGGIQSGAAPARSKLVDAFAPSGALGQSFAVMTVGMMLGGMVAPPVFGALIETVGLRPTFLGMAAVTAAVAALAALILTTYDDQFSLRRPTVTSDD